MNRIPSPPWSVCPVVSGISDAVMPMRNVPCADAALALAMANAARVTTHLIDVMVKTLRIAGFTSCSLEPDGSEIFEPVLRLHEAFDFRREGMRIGVVHDPHEHGVVNHQFVRCGHQLVLLCGIESALGFVDDGVNLRIRIPAPIDADWRNLAR